jgi:hypothetical protein
VLDADTLLLQKNYKSLVLSQIKNIFCYLFNALAFYSFCEEEEEEECYQSVSSLPSDSYRLTRLPNWPLVAS